MTAEAQDAGPAPIHGVGPSPFLRARLFGAAEDAIIIRENFGPATVMRRVSLSRFAGVLIADSAGRPDVYDIALVSSDGFAVALTTVPELDSIAVWRAEAKRYGLPMVIWSDGVGLVTIEPAESIGEADPHGRRRGAAATRVRRPRFLRRRKTSRLPLDPVVHREPDHPGTI